MSTSDRYLAAAFAEAARLDHPYLSREHFLLVLLREDSVAARVLRRHDVTEEKVEYELRRHADHDERRYSGTITTAATAELTAFADGLATGLGAPEVTAEHALLSLLWEPMDGLFAALGTSRETLLDTLREEGVAGADRPYPPTDRRRWGPHVDVPLERLGDLLRELHRLLPSGAGLSFNHDGEKAWIAAPEGIELEPLIPVALAAADAD